MELSRNIRRGNHDGVGLFLRIYLRMKVAALQPKVINPILNLSGSYAFASSLLIYRSFLSSISVVNLYIIPPNNPFVNEKAPYPPGENVMAITNGTPC